MVNNVIGMVNYVIAARPSLLNFVIADNDITLSNSGRPRRPLTEPPFWTAGAFSAITGCDAQIRSLCASHRPDLPM